MVHGRYKVKVDSTFDSLKVQGRKLVLDTANNFLLDFPVFSHATFRFNS